MSLGPDRIQPPGTLANVAKLVSVPSAVRARRRRLNGLPMAERTYSSVRDEFVAAFLRGPSLWVGGLAAVVFATLLYAMWMTFACGLDRPQPWALDSVLMIAPWMTLIFVLALVATLVVRWQRPAMPHTRLATRIATVLVGVSSCVWFGYWYWRSIDRNREGIDARVGIAWDTVLLVAPKAMMTLGFWLVIFFLVDRWRPQRLLMWFLALGWGGTVACFGSLIVNSHVAELIGAKGIEEMTGARSAVYVAPFVEEFFKATVLFWLAILLRYRLVNRLSMISLAGLSAAGFAFTENIVYYARAYNYAMQNPTMPPEKVLDQMFWLRGVMTAWGHPFFTIMTGLGLALGLSARSKSIRILAPVSGWLLAALGHMFFNTMASTVEDTKFYLFVGGGIAVSGVMFVISTSLMTGRLIRARLMDYVVMGWLPQSDLTAFGTWNGRVRILWLSLFELNTPATLALIRAETELAYLRDGITKGRIDKAGLDRERELFAQIRLLRLRAVTDVKAKRRHLFRRTPKPTPQLYSVSSSPTSAGIGGNWSVPGAATPTKQYSAVDPAWGPPA